eukprot:jgi/Chrzof1/11400/Cz05g35100.t1
MSMVPFILGNDPFLGNLDRVMDRAMGRALSRGVPDLSVILPDLTAPAGGHPMDIVETDDAYVVMADAPGFNPDEVNIELNDNVLTISGEKKQEREEKDREGRVVRRERAFTRFTRSFTLPDNVKKDDIRASLDKGVLRVTVPKAEEQRKPEPKRITVRGAESPAGESGAGAQRGGDQTTQVPVGGQAQSGAEQRQEQQAAA